MPTLIALSYSPWSEKARWALDHHHQDYREIEYVPMLGEPVLRVALRRPFGKVTVPAFIDGETRLMDSLEIARYVDRRGRSETLFPDQLEAEIESWNARSEALMAAGRGLTVLRTAQSPDALREALPPLIPEALRPALAPVAQMGTAFLRRKYSVGERPAEAHREAAAGVLRALRDALSSKREYVLGSFTFADIAMAAALQFVNPVGNGYVRIGEATRAVWTDAPLSEEFADLLAWRDRVYVQHR